jgi:hypothetical protein
MLSRIGVPSALIVTLVVACGSADLDAKDQPKDKAKDAGVKNNCEDVGGPCNKNEQCCSNLCRTDIAQCYRAPTCRALGETCTGDQDCCNLVACTWDGTAGGTYRCGAAP